MTVKAVSERACVRAFPSVPQCLASLTILKSHSRGPTPSDWFDWFVHRMSQWNVGKGAQVYETPLFLTFLFMFPPMQHCTTTTIISLWGTKWECYNMMSIYELFWSYRQTELALLLITSACLYFLYCKQILKWQARMNEQTNQQDYFANSLFLLKL